MTTTAERVAERSASGRSLVTAALDLVMPCVVGNPFIPHWPTPPQALFLGLHQSAPQNSIFQALYGGAAGGGKSDALLMAAAQYAWRNPDFSGILFRQTYADLSLPGAIMDRAISWWGGREDAHWDGSGKVFRFKGGGRITFSYLKNQHDHVRYQGSEYHFTGWDELTQWAEPKQYEYVGISRVRRKAGCAIPLRTLAASNPGGKGHDWVARMFIGGVDPATGLHVPAKHSYVPARVRDNPHIDVAAYERSLERLHPTVRAQLLNGDWRAREPGDYFRAEWFGPLLDPEVDQWPSRDCIKIRWWDLAASESETAARTAGVLMARHRSGVRAVLHCAVFRATPGSRDDAIVQQAMADGHGVICGLEIEGGSGGPAQFFALEKRLKAHGIRVVGARPRAQLTDAEGKTMQRQPTSGGGKEARADPVASCLERGYHRRGEGRSTGSIWWGADANLPLDQHRDGIRLMAGPWVQNYLDELMGFPDAPRCDLVDATSGAWAWLEAHPAGASQPFAPATPKQVRSQAQDDHPTDRDGHAGTKAKWRS